MVGTVYWDFLGSCQSLSLTVSEREEEGREILLARAELVFTSTADGREGRWRTGLVWFENQVEIKLSDFQMEALPISDLYLGDLKSH